MPFKKDDTPENKKGQNALGNNRFFDAKMGIAGAFLMGGIVYFINADHGFYPGLIAGLKQAFYTVHLTFSIRQFYAFCINLVIH